jgi:ATP-binding cassette subfamily C protein LapB
VLCTPGFQDANLENPNRTPTSAKGWFIHAIFKRRRVFLEGALATLLVGLFGLAASLYTMQVYDRVIPLKGYSTLVVLTVGVLIAIGLELLMKQVRASMVERTCKAIDQELSDVFFSKALSIRLDARPRTVGTFASQIRHFESVRNFMTSTTLMILADIPLALLFVFVIGLIAGWVSLVPLLAIPIAVFAGFLFKKPLRAITQDQIQQSNYKNGLLIEAIDGIESIKASGAEWKVQSSWNKLTKDLANKELRMRLLTNLSTQLTQTVHQLSYVGMIAFGAYLVAEGNLTMGGLIACSIIASRALQPIGQLPSVITQWQSAEISMEALDQIMDMPDDRPPGQRLVVPEQFQGKLRLEQIKFQYDPSQTVLDINRLVVQPGERVAILGAIGSGKSTLIKMMAGLYLPSSGRIFIDDIDLFQIAQEFVREHIAYLPQDVRLFNGTLRENLTLGLPNPSDTVIMGAAKECGLANASARHPKGLELMIHEVGKGLSGGQRQLVGLTRMLIASPHVLLLDEPTASMDPSMEMYVLEHLFEKLPKSSTVVMATHKAASLKHVDRVIVMQQGSIALDGPRDEVLKKLTQTQASAG